MATPRTPLPRGAWCAEPELGLFSASRSLRLGIGSPVRDAAIWLVGAARVRRSSAGPCLRVSQRSAQRRPRWSWKAPVRFAPDPDVRSPGHLTSVGHGRRRLRRDRPVEHKDLGGHIGVEPSRTHQCDHLARRQALNLPHEVVSHRPLELVSETPHQFLLAVGEKSALSPGQSGSHHYRDDVVPIEGARRCWTPPDGSAVAAHNGRCDRLVESGARGRVFVVGHRRARIGTLIVDRGPHARTDRQR